MGYVLKGNKYRLVDNRSFELPLPVKYELLKEDSTIAEYEISGDETVSCRIITKYKEEMITPINRPLDISDIYYFFSCRVFQDRTPFTMAELSLLGLEKYNVYDIIRKTRGVTPFDTYWLRFDGDKCDYETARKAWNDLMSQVGGAAAQSTSQTEDSAPKSDADVNEILHQHKIDVAAKFAAEAENTKADLSNPEPVSNNTMSADEIEALLLKSGLSDIAADDKSDKPESVEEKSASGGTMSQDDIEKMLAAASAPEPEPTAEPAPVEEKPTSGGMMSQDDIEKMLAAASAPEPETVAEPAPVEEKPANGGKMSQDDIEKMLAAASDPETVAEPAPVEEKPTSGGKMSQDDIEKMLAAVSDPEPETVAEPAPVEEKPASGGKMSQDDIEKMLAAASDPEPEPVAEPAPVEEKTASGGKMSQDDIEKMLAAASGAVENIANDVDEAVQETLDSAPEPVAEPAPAEEKSAEASGGKMSQADIEALLNGMKEDATT